MLPPLVRFQPDHLAEQDSVEQAEHDPVEEVQGMSREERLPRRGEDGDERAARSHPVETVGKRRAEDAVVERPRQHGQSDRREHVSEIRAELCGDEADDRQRGDRLGVDELLPTHGWLHRSPFVDRRCPRGGHDTTPWTPLQRDRPECRSAPQGVLAHSGALQNSAGSRRGDRRSCRCRWRSDRPPPRRDVRAIRRSGRAGRRRARH